MVLAETAVIVHPSNVDSINRDQVSRIFLGKLKSFPNGSQVIAINLAEGDGNRLQFDESVLGKSASQLKAYWSKLVFTGKATPPKSVDSVAEAKALVSSNPNTIAYIPAAEVDDSVKVVFVF